MTAELKNLLQEDWNSIAHSKPETSVFLAQYSDFYEEDDMQVFRDQVEALRKTLGKYDMRMKEAAAQSTHQGYTTMVDRLRYELQDFNKKLIRLKVGSHGT